MDHLIVTLESGLVVHTQRSHSLEIRIFSVAADPLSARFQNAIYDHLFHAVVPLFNTLRYPSLVLVETDCESIHSIFQRFCPSVSAAEVVSCNTPAHPDQTIVIYLRPAITDVHHMAKLVVPIPICPLLP